MILLAVETSGATASIALVDRSGIIHERIAEGAGRQRTRTLVSDIDRLLKDCGIQPKEIESVAVSVGPGSFTGLRIGIVFAKTFSWSIGSHLIAVETFATIADQTRDSIAGHDVRIHDSRITVISDAQRGEFFAADFATVSETGELDVITPLRIIRTEELSPNSLITGPGIEKLPPSTQSLLRLAAPEVRQPRAASIARTALKMAALEQFANPDTLEPIYVRRSYAEEKSSPAGSH
ncbi:MAG: tRNA (adenosine(37)-N6)-threonylcarbamoyltransferase complex dimerization subunit type 1 TsaB [Planctomyces sp.]